MKEFTIHLIGGKEKEAAKLSTEIGDRDCHITFQYRDKILESHATDFFEAFCHIRTQLEKDHLLPLCYGASLDVYPSGMCRDMGGGMVAYKMEIGKRGTGEELVDIFEEGVDVIPSTVKDQRQYFREWLQSIKNQQNTAKHASITIVPSRVEGIEGVERVSVFPDKLEVVTHGTTQCFLFSEISQPQEPGWWSSIKKFIGLHALPERVADRNWCCSPKDRFFRFYTEPEFTICMPDDEVADYTMESYFVQIKEVIKSGSYVTYDLG